MGKQQELSVLAYLVKRPELFFEFHSGQLHDLQFQYKQASLLFRLLRANFDRHHQVPTEDELLWRVRNHADIRKQPILIRTSLELCVKEIYNREVSETTGDYIAAFILDREAAGLQGLLTKLTDAGEIDKASDHLLAVQEKCERLQRLIKRESHEGLSLPFEDESLENIEEYVSEGYGGKPISTRFPKLNYRTRGGLHLKEFSLFIGGTGLGKTTFAVSEASFQLSKGLAVCYIALDNSQGDLRSRFFASTTGIPINLDTPMEEWARQVQKQVPNLRNKRFKLAIQHLPAKSANLNDLKILVRQLEDKMYRRCLMRNEEFNGFDLIYLDYIDLLNPIGRPSKEKRHDLQDITQGCMGWASETAKHIVGFSQTNVGGLTAEVVGLENLAEAYSKSWAAALLGCICQTEAEYLDGYMRMAFPKNRNGPKNFIIHLEVNYENNRVREREDIEEVYQIQGTASNTNSNGRGKAGRKKGITGKEEIEYGGPTG